MKAIILSFDESTRQATAPFVKNSEDDERLFLWKMHPSKTPFKELLFFQMTKRASWFPFHSPKRLNLAVFSQRHNNEKIQIPHPQPPPTQQPLPRYCPLPQLRCRIVLNELSNSTNVLVDEHFSSGLFVSYLNLKQNLNTVYCTLYL